MQVITLDEIGSTNDFLKALVRTAAPQDLTAVVAHRQTQGRGQQGNSWHAQPGANLTFSVYKQLELPPEDHFVMNMAVSLILQKALAEASGAPIDIKWPNDLYSKGKKIGGVLIENISLNQRRKHWIVGIGVNVNQTEFPALPQASSLKNICGRAFHLESILKAILTAFENYPWDLEAAFKSGLWDAYERLLLHRGKVRTYKNALSERLFNGIIRGVARDGKLCVETEDGRQAFFSNKEIIFLN